MKCLNWLKPRPRLECELFQDLKGEWRFRVKASNHEIVAQSEAYTRRESAEDTARMLCGARLVMERVA